MREFLRRKTIAIHVNVDDNPDLAKRFGVRPIPAIVFVDASGNERGRILGYKAPDAFLRAAASHVGG